MRAVYFKELRENAHWVPLGILVVGLAVYLAVPAQNAVFYAAQDLDYSLAVSLGLAAGAFAIFLGVLQSLMYHRTDAYGFAIHRAVSASGIAFAKMASGATLYAAATLTPLIVGVVYFASRDINFSPLHPEQLWLSFWTVLLCFGLHPTTMLVFARKAAWQGTRLLPFLAAAVAITAFVVAESTAVFQLAFSVAAFLIFALIAYAGMHEGKIRTGVLVLSSLVAVAGVQLLLNGAFESFARSYEVAKPALVYELDPNGDLWLVEVSRSRNPEGKEYLAGSEIVDGLDATSGLGELPNDFSGVPLSVASHWVTRASKRSFYEMTMHSSEENRYLHPDGYWLVYNGSLDVPLVGTITQDGLRAGFSPGGRRFASDTKAIQVLFAKKKIGHLLWGSGGLWLYDSQEGTTKLLFEHPVDWVAPLGNWNAGPMDLLVGSEDHLHRLKLVDSGTAGGSQTQDWYADDGDLWLDVEAVETSKLPAPPKQFRNYMMVGAVDDQYTVLSEPNFATLEPGTQVWKTGRLQSFQTASADSLLFNCIAGLTAPVLVVSHLLGSVWYLGNPVQLQFNGSLVAGAIVLLVSLVLVVYLCSRRACTSTQTWAWVCATLLLGAATPLAVLAIYPRLYFESCQHCGRSRRVDRAKCEHCGAERDEISSGGIGLFDREQNVRANAVDLVAQA